MFSLGSRVTDAEDSLDERYERALVSAAASPERLLEIKDDADALWRAVKALPAEYRVPLVLFEVEGLGYDAIAQVEGVPIGTVRSRLSRGREQLAAPMAAQERRGRRGTEAGARSSNSGGARP